MMTTDNLVREWEDYCEQLDLSPDALRRIEDAQEEIGKAVKRISQAMDLIESKELQLMRLHALATRMTASFREGGGSGSVAGDFRQDTVCDIVEAQKQLAASVAAMLRLWVYVTSAIERIDRPVYRIVLERHWLLGDSWEVIAEVLHYDPRYVQYLAQHAREALQEVLDGREDPSG